MTPAEADELRDAQELVLRTEAAHKAALKARDALLRHLYRPGDRAYGPTALARVVDMHRVTVDDIVRPKS